ncbi:MAG TPA: hypothetical protein VH157_13815, partial [Bryobacteraceae bacterium]|nr:hypothetical protein [Bryobacteraceae bacterium]
TVMFDFYRVTKASHPKAFMEGVALARVTSLPRKIDSRPSQSQRSHDPIGWTPRKTRVPYVLEMSDD